MNNFTVILLGFLPSVPVLLAVLFFLRKMLENNENQRVFELKKTNLQYITPIRLRAYERLMLLLERTTPKNLILNNFKAGMTCLDLQIELQNTVRQEFSHNISQQIFVSSPLWETISDTKESILNLINLCASKCPPNENAEILAKGIIEIYENEPQNPTENAEKMLKNEVGEIF